MRRLPPLLRSVFGVSLCALYAILASIVFQQHHIAPALPLFFLLLVVPITIKFGPTAAIGGTLLAAVFFALYLFPPLGALSVSDSIARSNLAWMILGSLISAQLFGPAEK